MGRMAEAYITGIGAYLPGEPVDNEQLMTRLTDGTTGVPGSAARPSRRTASGPGTTRWTTRAAR